MWARVRMYPRWYTGPWPPLLSFESFYGQSRAVPHRQHRDQEGAMYGRRKPQRLGPPLPGSTGGCTAIYLGVATGERWSSDACTCGAFEEHCGGARSGWKIYSWYCLAGTPGPRGAFRLTRCRPRPHKGGKGDNTDGFKRMEKV